LAPHLVITEQRVGDVAVLSLNGWLIADEQDVQFRDHIDALVRDGITKIVVDLHDVTLLDSGGVGVLIAKFLTLRNRGGDLRLAPSDRAHSAGAGGHAAADGIRAVRLAGRRRTQLC
jgi:anti-anti-sigma factor